MENDKKDKNKSKENSQEKSQIDSFNISFALPPGEKKPSAAQLPSSASPSTTSNTPAPWNILVCSDLGFTSKAPQRVLISEWNDFMRSQNIVLSGTVPGSMSSDKKPQYFEHAIKSMNDFESESLVAASPVFSAWSKAIFALEQLLSGKTTPQDAASLIRRAGLPAEEEQRIVALLGIQPAIAPKISLEKPDASAVDRILSMVGPSKVPAPAPQVAAGDFVSALAASASGMQGNFDKAGIAAYVDECKMHLHDAASLVQSQEFFISRWASWTCLMRLAKLAGRKKEAVISVFSCEKDTMPDMLENVLGQCMQAGAAADMILWDYDVSFSNADMERAANIASVADRFKCSVVAPLSMSDPLLSGIGARQSIGHMFEEVRFLPFKKLRDSESARCLTLCAPALVLSGFGNGSLHKTARSPWFTVTFWLEMLLSDSDPFCIKQPPRRESEVFSGLPIFIESVAEPVSQEAASMGLTLFLDSLEDDKLSRVVSVISEIAAAPSYSSMAFNMLVNRVMRLTGSAVLFAGANKAGAAAPLSATIKRELARYGALGPGGVVDVSMQDNGTLAVEINSDTTISGHPVRFSFSM